MHIERVTLHIERVTLHIERVTLHIERVTLHIERIPSWHLSHYIHLHGAAALSKPTLTEKSVQMK